MLTGLALEISRDEHLEPCQLMALCGAREAARCKHEAALPRLRERAERLGFSPGDVDATLKWIEKQAPIVIPVDLEKIGFKLAEDTHFRNQFETESCPPVEDLTRAGWEEALFQGAYHDAPSALRCKYGVLNVTNDMSGVLKGSGSTVWSYLLLRNARHRVTLTSFDTITSYDTLTGAFKCKHSACLATIDYYAHVLEEYKDAELAAALKVGTRRSHACDSSIMKSLKEVQIHGNVKLTEDIELVLVNPKLRSGSFTPMIERLADHCKARITWLDAAPVPDPVPSVALSGDDALEMALKASLEYEENDRRLWQREAEDIARALELSAPSSAPISARKEDESLAKAIEASIEATNAAVASIASKAETPVTSTAYPNPMPSPAVAEAASMAAGIETGPSTEYVLKASLENDVRRFRLSWPSFASTEEIVTSIRGAVQKSFELSIYDPYCLKYEDEDGDLCTLVTGSVSDYLSSRQGSVLRKLRICKKPQTNTATTLEPEASSSGNVGDEAAHRRNAAAVRIQSLQRSRQAYRRNAAAVRIQSLQRGRQAYRRNAAAVRIQSLQHGRQAYRRNAAAVRIQSLQRGRHVRAVVKVTTCMDLDVENANLVEGVEEVQDNESQKGDESEEVKDTECACVEGPAESSLQKTEDLPAVGTADIEDTDVRGADVSADVSTDDVNADVSADSSGDVGKEFSMVTPPGSPRGQTAEMTHVSSIEDEYTDEYIAWTFVAEPAK